MGHYFINDLNLESEIKKHDINIKGISYYFYTDNGVFSKEGLDYGTKLLIESIPYINNDKTILDIGCGTGPIGIYFSVKGFSVDMTDVNNRAIHLSKRAIKEQSLSANVFESFAYENINKKYDYIISNPPIKAGKKVLYDIVIGAKDHLNNDGKLFIVIRKDKGAKSLVKDMSLYYNKTEILEKKKGFLIICLYNQTI